jgi:hypothetical protein
MPKRRGLPVAVTPTGATTFEHLVAKLGLAPEQYENSIALKEWARKHKNVRYVPPQLLQAWCFTVDTGPESSLGDHGSRKSPRMALE